ncbi:hypothetical protein [Curtobacterium sp. NPDC086286]|jgi:tetratricopeptide (TPR) repeat protein|uniref:hypothetical protein n=1 Tax=Curtobacterium sp. NPDC086286 TaxID=3363964 RepID=UPI0038051883
MADAVDVVVERADALLGFKRPDDARAVLTAAGASTPDDPRLWATLARAERARHDHAASRTAAERALALDPDNATALSARVNAMLDANERQAAKAAAEELRERRPDWATAHLLWAFAHTRWSHAKRSAAEEAAWPTADVARSAAALDRALELAPHDARLFADAAQCYRALSWTDGALAPRAREAMDRALELDPNDEWVMLAAGSVLQLSERVAQSARVLAQHPTSWEARRRVDDGLWSLVSVPVGVVAWSLVVTVLGAHIAAGGGANAVTKTLGWTLTGIAALWVCFVEVHSFAKFPRGLLLRTMRRVPLVPVVLGVAALTWIAGAAGAVLLLAGIVPPAGDGYTTIVTVLAVALLLQSAAQDVTTIVQRRRQVRSGLWDGLVADRGRRRKEENDRGGAYIAGFAALVTWGIVALAAPTTGTWAVAAVPLLLATRVFVLQSAAEILRAVGRPRRARLVVYAVIALGFAAFAVRAVVVQVLVAAGVA